jgi:hypothetical protein
VLVSVRGRLVEIVFTAVERKMAEVHFDEVAAGVRTARSGKAEVRTVVGRAARVGDGADDGPVETGFLGIEGDLKVLLLRESGLPVEVSGRNKDFGGLRVRLEEVHLRPGRTLEDGGDDDGS